MLIYCNGDSFTQGAELADNLVVGWPGYQKNAEMTAERKKFLDHKSIIDHKWVDMSKVGPEITSLPELDDRCVTPWHNHVIQALMKIEKYRAWPNQIHLIDPSIEVINNAIGGAGIAGICQRTVVDLISLKKQNKKVDLVIIQLTGMTRQEIYSHLHNTFMYERFVFSDRDHWPHPDDYEIAQAILKKYDDRDYTIKYLYTLCSAVEAVHSLTSKYPIIVDSMNRSHIQQAIATLKHHVYTRNIKEELERCSSLIEGSMIEEIYPTSMFDLTQKFSHPYCVKNHYSEEVQKEFARNIYENICLR